MQKISLTQSFYLMVFLAITAMNNLSANIGKVLLAVGEVNAQREQLIPLTRGDELLEKDVVLTGIRGRAQLLMIDGAKIAVKPSSEIFLEQYVYNKPSDIKVIGQSKSSMTLSLIKGGFRTISGAIGAGTDKSNYKVKTPIATIGIRGTDYSVLICNLGCVSLDGMKQVAEGIYFGVTNGSIAIENSVGQLLLSSNQFAFLSSANEPPVRITTPPLNLMSDSTNPAFEDKEGEKHDEDRIEGTETDEPESEAEEAEPELIEDRDGIDPESEDEEDRELDPETTTLEDETEIVVSQDTVDDTGTIIRIDDTIHDFSRTQSIAYAGSFGNKDGFSIVTKTPIDSLSGTNSGLTGFYALSPNNNIGTEYAIQNAQQYNVGYDPESGIAWGRWSDSFMALTSASGARKIDLSNSSLHWAMDSVQSGQPLPISGSASYTLVGNTDPTNNLGEVGALGTASFFVDFTNQTVSNGLTLSIGGSIWSASGSGSIADGTHWFSGTYDTVSIDGIAGGAGDFAGFFSNMLDNISGLPAGAGLVYNLLDDPLNPMEIVNGTVIFGRPTP